MQVVKGKKDNEKRDYCILLIIRQMTHTFWMIIGNAFRKLCQQQRKKKNDQHRNHFSSVQISSIIFQK